MSRLVNENMNLKLIIKNYVKHFDPIVFNKRKRERLKRKKIESYFRRQSITWFTIIDWLSFSVLFEKPFGKPPYYRLSQSSVKCWQRRQRKQHKGWQCGTNKRWVCKENHLHFLMRILGNSCAKTRPNRP